MKIEFLWWNKQRPTCTCRRYHASMR